MAATLLRASRVPISIPLDSHHSLAASRPAVDQLRSARISQASVGPVGDGGFIPCAMLPRGACGRLCGCMGKVCPTEHPLGNPLVNLLNVALSQPSQNVNAFVLIFR